MRKRILQHNSGPAGGDGWLEIERLAVVEVSSEDPDAPIEPALTGSSDSGWRAAQSGPQTIKLLFDEPQTIRRIWLRFVESSVDRTHEFVLRWSADRGRSFHETVRQRWSFSPDGATQESEDYQVDLQEVTVLELTINPDVSGGAAVASLLSMRLA
jgi:hypothetical protein